MKTKHMQRWSALLACGALALANLGLGGCARYTLGSNLPPGIKSVYVPVFINKAGEPNLEFETTNRTIEEFQKDGSLKIAPQDQADTVLEVTLTHYRLTPLRYRKNQATTAQEYRLTITADLVFRKLPTKEVLAQAKNVEGFSDFKALTDLPSARRAALPDTAKSLATHILKNVTEYW